MKKLVFALALLLAIPAFAEDKEGGPTFMAVPLPSGAGQFLGTDGNVPEWETLQDGAGNCSFNRDYAGSYVLVCPGYVGSNNPTFSGIITFTPSSWVIGPDNFILNGSGLSVNDITVNSQFWAPDGGHWGGHGIATTNISANYGNITQLNSGTISSVNLYNSQFLETYDLQVDDAAYIQTENVNFLAGVTADVRNLFVDSTINTRALLVQGLVPGGTCTGGQFVDAIDQNLQTTCATPTVVVAPGSITDADLANAYSGVGTCAAHKWASTLTRNAAPTCTQPAVADVSGLGALASLNVGTSLASASGNLNLSMPATSCTGGQFMSALSATGTGTCTSPPATGITSLTAGTGITFTPSSPITSTGTIAVTSGLYLPVNNPTFTGTLTGPTLSITGSATIGSLTTTTMFQAPDGSYWNSSYLNMTKPLWFNGAVMGGTCTAGQYVSALSGTGILTCGTPAGGSNVSITAGNTGITVSPSPLTGTGTVALAANPAGGALNFAPIASPTFIGTVVAPTLSASQVNVSGGGFWNSSVLNLTASALQFNGVALGGTCTGGQYVSALSGVGVITCGTPLTGTMTGVGFNFAGLPPASIIGAFTCPVGLTIGTNFVNSKATCGTNPSESDAYTVKVNGTSIGTITLNTSCTAALGTATLTTCAAGQRMEIDAPAIVSGKDIAITIAVTR